MYTITVCRRGNHYKNTKGFFKKEFNTLDEIVKFYLNANDNLYFPEIRKELTRREVGILCNKFSAQAMLSK